MAGRSDVIALTISDENASDDDRLVTAARPNTAATMANTTFAGGAATAFAEGAAPSAFAEGAASTAFAVGVALEAAGKGRLTSTNLAQVAAS